MASRISTADKGCLLVILGSRSSSSEEIFSGPKNDEKASVSHFQTTLSQWLENFVMEDVVAGLEEELPLLRHAISGALADTKEWTRTNLLWTNTFFLGVAYEPYAHLGEWVNGCQLDEPNGFPGPVTTSRMQQCFNVLIDIYHEFLLFYCCVLLEIKLTKWNDGWVEG